jgi:copper chaperone
MNQLKFTSNIKCGGCIAKVTPFFNEEKRIRSWQVDITHPQKILTVETDQLSPEEVKSLVAKAGFKAEVAGA